MAVFRAFQGILERFSTARHAVLSGLCSIFYIPIV